jgi:hypothetical protein
MMTAVICASCTDFVNDYHPAGLVTDATYWKTDQDFINAIDPIYYTLLTGDGELFGRDLFYEIGICGDDMISSGKGGDNNRSDKLYDFSMDGRQVSIRNNNNRCTEIISKANWFIYTLVHTIGEANLSPLAKRTLGEAYWIRAYGHFLYAYRMGRADNGVPFDRYEDYDPYTYGIPEQRATVMENFDLIIQDLQKAEALLPFFKEYGEADWGRTHKAAAWALMVKTYAWWGAHDHSKWDLIPPLVDKIETQGERSLHESFSDLFTVEKGNWSAEDIYSINGSSVTAPVQYTPVIFPINTGWFTAYNTWGGIKPTLELYEEFEPGDKRRIVTMFAYGDTVQWFGREFLFFEKENDPSGFMFTKYYDPFRYGEIINGKGVSPYVSQQVDGRTDQNIPLFRFAEMLLFKAEALIEQGKGAEAAQVLNRITRRAGLGDKYTNATMADLMHQRRCELACEYSDRYGDLRRWCITNDANHRGLALPKLNGTKHVRLHEDRSDPESSFTVIEVSRGANRQFNPDIHIVMPYDPDDVLKADGKLRQNKGY